MCFLWYLTFFSVRHRIHSLIFFFLKSFRDDFFLRVKLFHWNSWTYDMLISFLAANASDAKIERSTHWSWIYVECTRITTSSLFWNVTHFFFVMLVHSCALFIDWSVNWLFFFFCSEILRVVMFADGETETKNGFTVAVVVDRCGRERQINGLLTCFLTFFLFFGPYVNNSEQHLHANHRKLSEHTKK